MSTPDIEYPIRVAQVIRETEDASSFVLEIPTELAEAFRYRAGQFLTFRVPFGETTLTRSYSLSSSPECDDHHKVTVKRITDGRISHWFNDRVSEGDVLRVRAPAGLFCLRESDREIVLFSGGSGITPVISIVKTALATTARKLTLVYANRDANSIIFREELEALERAHPERLQLLHRLDADHGFARDDDIREYAAGHEAADFYICGPDVFMDTVERTLEAMGVERERIFIERFVSPPDPGESESANSAGVAASISVLFNGKTHELQVEAGKTILETAKDAGIDPPFSCEEGYCSSCMAKLLEGSAEMRQNECLTQRDVDEGWILACQALPTTPRCRISWDD